MKNEKHKNHKSIMKPKDMVLGGVMVALAMVLGYLESLLPISLGIPGVKLGLANLVILIAIYKLPVNMVVMISLIRVVLSSVLFSNLSVLIYSFAGAICSLMVMYVLKRFSCFSKIGVSIGGGVFHNVGQLIVAGIMIQNQSILYYMPWLMLSGIVSGILIGYLAYFISKRLPD